MVFRGIARGRTIEFEQPLPFQNGEPVEVSVSTVGNFKAPVGSPARILTAMQEAPHLSEADIEEFNRSLAQAQRPATGGGIFDENGA